ncbi:hypothetical protein CTheo_9097 [Ceratobasidium theobromae]|uniref:Uncharacterized protein n=1 Tax=Ceratobasidium theobromae TaxID=1582974 RepID=A0A5N5Q6I4_9AGAM|nr:hypothetical protein CTheo_9097 [Ceratobasidium theobromae]
MPPAMRTRSSTCKAKEVLALSSTSSTVATATAAGHLPHDSLVSTSSVEPPVNTSALESSAKSPMLEPTVNPQALGPFANPPELELPVNTPILELPAQGLTPVK